MIMIVLTTKTQSLSSNLRLGRIAQFFAIVVLLLMQIHLLGDKTSSMYGELHDIIFDQYSYEGLNSSNQYLQYGHEGVVTSAKHVHRPRRFSEETQLNIHRGLNLVNQWSGQRIATWIYDGQQVLEKKQCSWVDVEEKEKFLKTRKDVKKVDHNDTIFVAHGKLQEFVSDFLPYLEVEVVIISTAFQNFYPPGLEPVGRNFTQNSHVLHWFVCNVNHYSGGMQDHPKVSPFPLGLKPKMGGRDFQNPIPHYRKAFMKFYNTTHKKSTSIFVGYLARTTSARDGVPNAGKRIPYKKYLENIAEAHYVICPDGRNPDCHRNYESIGLGAVPITQLDPRYYNHFEEGSIVYNVTEWNLTKLEETLPVPTIKAPNRNMIFEEYWLEYMEHRAGRPLRWWDVLQGKSAMLDDFLTSPLHVE
jgi:hypothetical protein